MLWAAALAAASEPSVRFDIGSTIAQFVIALIGPTGLVALVLVRQQRANLRSAARATDAGTDETEAKAEVLLSGEAMRLFLAARADQTAANIARVAAESDASTLRRQKVDLWARVDEHDRYARQLEALLDAHHIERPPRPGSLLGPLP